MNTPRIAPLLIAAVLALGGCASTAPGLLAADAPRALPAAGPVSVAWEDPAGFSELRYSGNRFLSAHGNWLPALARHLRQRGEAVLSPGERLEVTIVDVHLAGRYEPWRGADMQDVRVVRDIYPPRIILRFRHLDPSGAVVAEGERKLFNPGFLSQSVTPPRDADGLRHEKQLIDRWLRREMGSTAAR